MVQSKKNSKRITFTLKLPNYKVRASKNGKGHRCIFGNKWRFCRRQDSGTHLRRTGSHRIQANT
jgi:hypothetical protein